MTDENILEIPVPVPADADRTPAEAVSGSGQGCETPCPTADLPERQYCVFRAGTERYCLSVLEIEEVVEWPKVTPVPLAPDYLTGIFNLRGANVPIVDLAIGRRRELDSPQNRVVVGFTPGADGHTLLRIGMAADEVIGTHTTTDMPTREGVAANAPHCVGQLSVSDGPVAVLEVRGVIEMFPAPAI